MKIKIAGKLYDSSTTKLDLSNKGLTKIPNLDKFTNLEGISLSGNNLSSLKGFPELPELAYLDLYKNNLTSLKGFPNLPKLVYLDLYENNLTSLKGLPKLPELSQLYLTFSFFGPHFDLTKVSEKILGIGDKYGNFGQWDYFFSDYCKENIYFALDRNTHTFRQIKEIYLMVREQFA